MIWWAAYFLAGGFVGFLAGLLGIGGGLTLVPILASLFAAQDLSPAHAVHLALGTGMASIMFTSSASVLEHHRHKAVDWKLVARIAPGMLAGTLLATVASGSISQRALAMAFAVIAYGGATQLLLGRKPSPLQTLPRTLTLLLVSTAIGIICGLVSAGGAFLTVPFMLFCGVPMHSAIGTAAALGIPVAIVGTVGYVVSGIKTGGLPDHSLGFVFLPALFALVLGSMATARFGARTAHRLQALTLRRIYAVLLYLLATKMLLTYW